MPGKIEITLKDLVKIALGAPEINKINLMVLHSLIDLMLKKLDCENEKVTISGYEAMCLEGILDQSKISPLALDDEGIEIISKKLDRLEGLEERISTVDSKLQKHLRELKMIRKLKPTPLNLTTWEEYERVCEDLCTLCDPENEVACSLLKNESFLQKLSRRVDTPVVDRIFEFERKIQELAEEMDGFLKRAQAEYEKIALIDVCMDNIKKLKDRMVVLNERFVSTMEEVQDMLDAKMDKAQMPPLKNFIKDRFADLCKQFNKLITEKSCPRASAVLMNLKCLTCGFDKACADEYPNVMPLMPDMNANYQKPRGKFCACGVAFTPRDPKAAKLHTRIEQLRLLEELPHEERTVCKQARDNFEVLLGTDGNWYRSDA